MSNLKRVFILFIALAIAGLYSIAQAGECPQPRQTKTAPDEFQKMKNPKTSAEDVAAGKELFLKTAKPVVCWMCHGKTGVGDGPAGKAFKSPKAPRNFTCKDTMKDIKPGQLFWIIKNGSPGTGMAAYGKMMKDDQIWQIISYIETLAK